METLNWILLTEIIVVVGIAGLVGGVILVRRPDSRVAVETRDIGTGRRG